MLEQHILDIKVLTNEGYITDNMSDEQKYKAIKLNQQWLMVEDCMGNMKKHQYMNNDPDDFDYGMLDKHVYFIHCGIIGEGYCMAISRWHDRMYRIHSNKFIKPSSVHHSNIFSKIEDLFNHLNDNYIIEEK